MKKIYLLAAAAVAIPAALGAQTFNFPSGQKKGFTAEETTTVVVTTDETQGRSGKPAKENNNQGTAETTTTTTTVVEETGPRGVLKNNNSDNPNYDATIIAVDSSTAETDAPGRHPK